jgi:hypothetical protein
MLTVEGDDSQRAEAKTETTALNIANARDPLPYPMCSRISLS